MYQIEFSDAAKRDLKYEPNIETQNRKKMRPNPFAEWELRIGKFRVLYNVEVTVKIVSIEAIGVKVGSDFMIRGEKRDL